MNAIYIIIMILSFILDSVFSNIFNDSIFMPLISLMSIIVLKKKYKIENNVYLFFTALIGLLYDLIYTSTPVLNMMIYLLLGIIVIFFFKYFRKNLFNELLLSTILIVLYRTIIFIVLIISNILERNITILIKSIYSSLFLNYIYIVITYFIIKKINKKMNKADKIIKF